MTKSHSKFIPAVLALLVFAVFAVPSESLAQSSGASSVPSPYSAGTVPVGQFCQRVETLDTNMQKRLDDRLARVVQRRTDQLNKLQAKIEERDQNIAAKREEADAKRAELIAKLEAQAVTQEQKQAVATFKAAIEAAVTARRAAVNAAGKTFRDGVKQALNTRFDTTKSLAQAMRADVDAEYEKAKTECANGTEPKTARQTLIDNLKTLRAKYIEDLKAVDKVITQLETLKKTRNEAVKKAVDEFKATVQTAVAELKAAFPTTP